MPTSCHVLAKAWLDVDSVLGDDFEPHCKKLKRGYFMLVFSSDLSYTVLGPLPSVYDTDDLISMSNKDEESFVSVVHTLLLQHASISCSDMIWHKFLGGAYIYIGSF